MITRYDYAIIGFYPLFMLGLGAFFRRLSKNTSDYFRAGGGCRGGSPASRHGLPVSVHGPLPALLGKSIGGEPSPATSTAPRGEP